MAGQTVPRVAKSIQDLRVGQVVAWHGHDGEWRVSPPVTHPMEWAWTGTEVILSDPPPEPVTVSREAFERQVAALKLIDAAADREEYGPWEEAVDALCQSARALVDEVRGADGGS